LPQALRKFNLRNQAVGSITDGLFTGRSGKKQEPCTYEDC
jgi:hypothetical protein